MAYGNNNPKVGNNGEGIWQDAPTSNPFAGTGNPTGYRNMLDMVGSGSKTDKGEAVAGSGGNDLANTDQGTGSPDKGSPNQNLLSTISGGSSPDQGTGTPNRPSPEPNLLSTRGKSANSPTRPPYFGGTEKGVQVQ